MAESILFFLFAGMAIFCAISLVWHKNPLYSAISLIGVFISLACIYLSLASPFIAITQILVYAGAIMVLVVFVIMLLNVEVEEDKPLLSLNYLYAFGGTLGLALFAQAVFMMYAVSQSGNAPAENPTMGLTDSVGQAMYTQYLLPVEIVGFLLLMAIIGGVLMARKLEPQKLELIKEKEREIRNEEDFN